jgi:hypothetical protein
MFKKKSNFRDLDWVKIKVYLRRKMVLVRHVNCRFELDIRGQEGIQEFVEALREYLNFV